MERAISFWDFLNQYNIEIPIIQRDYAQGRKGKETLREMFLRNLKNAMDNNLSDKQEILILDFVYGSVKNGKLQPLDGQQRLTTLWLLHWYVALRAKKWKRQVGCYKNLATRQECRLAIFSKTCVIKTSMRLCLVKILQTSLVRVL